MTKRESREIIANIEKFTKRSKHITIQRENNYFQIYRLDIRVTRENIPVVNEFYAYLNSFCPFFDFDNYGKYPAKWFHSYDDSMDDSLPDGEYGFEICISLW